MKERNLLLPPPTPASAEGGSLSAFLALFLLVLAFFILLVSISTLEEVRSRAVMDSLSSTFATVLPPTTELTAFAAKEGEVIAGQQFQAEIAGVFATTMQVAQVEVVQPGRLMRVTMPARTLFLDDQAEVRPAREALLDRIVATLSSRPPGLLYDLEFIIHTPYADGRMLPTGDTLEARRTASFVRGMLARGAPPDSLAVGLDPGGETDQVVMLFHVRFPDEEISRYRHLGGGQP